MNSTLVDDTMLVKAGPSKESSLKESPSGSASRLLAKATISPWGWAAVTCLILGISGGVRFWRDWEFQTLAHKSEIPPFRLAELPRVLGTWRSSEEGDSKLDPEIARVAGSKDHVVRIYQDEKTGEEVSVLVLYGLATSVFSHLPQVCYPAAGYRSIAVPEDHELTVPGTTRVRFRRSYFAKKSGSLERQVEVCHTFLHNNEWLPEVDSRWKMFRLHPSMFKIQLERQASGPSFEDSPSESLLGELVGQINHRMADQSGRAENATKTAQATSGQK